MGNAPDIQATVWTVYWHGPGQPKYSAEYPYKLRDQVARNLRASHRFRVLTDVYLAGLDCLELRPGLGGWWNKVQLFLMTGGNMLGPHLYLDLDVYINGPLDGLLSEYRQCDLAMPNNWAKSGHGGCQSSVMVWNGPRSAKRIWDAWDPALANWPPVNRPGVLWGDQEWLTQLRDSGQIKVTPIHPALVKSYKYHCRAGVPAGCAVVVFHGKPDPHEVQEPWLDW